MFIYQTQWNLRRDRRTEEHVTKKIRYQVSTDYFEQDFKRLVPLLFAFPSTKGKLEIYNLWKSGDYPNYWMFAAVGSLIQYNESQAINKHLNFLNGWCLCSYACFLCLSIWGVGQGSLFCKNILVMHFFLKSSVKKWFCFNLLIILLLFFFYTCKIVFSYGQL